MSPSEKFAAMCKAAHLYSVEIFEEKQTQHTMER